MEEIKALEKWSSPLQKPLYIAGPCSAESEKQVELAASEISKIEQVSYFRAGIWKPRTRPGNFEGVGKEGLPWLQNVRKRYNLKVCTEVATPQHVELALDHQIDALWFGARTTASPFAIEELCNSLKGVEIPIFIKNPINDDLALWEGAIERLVNNGFSELAAIHRGFDVKEKSRYRNSPIWRIPIELKRKFPRLPIICDPSHISGDRENIQKVSQMAMDLGMDGLMIETHPDPDKALSDASQQITPKKLLEILSNLRLVESSNSNASFAEKLEFLRDKVDRVDHELIEALKIRTDLIQKIGELKDLNKVSPFQVGRMDELIKERRSFAKQLQLNPDFIQELFSIIHEESVRLQAKLGKEKK